MPNFSFLGYVKVVFTTFAVGWLGGWLSGWVVGWVGGVEELGIKPSQLSTKLKLKLKLSLATKSFPTGSL